MSKEELFNENKPLITYVINKMCLDNSKFEDYFQIGAIGLWKAINCYKEEKGFEFSTFATKCIKNELLLEMRKEAKQTPCISLDAPIKEEDGITFLDTISDNNIDYNKKFLIEKVLSLIPKLTKKQQLYLTERLNQLTFREIAEKYNDTTNNTLRTVENAVKALRRLMGKEVAEYYDDKG